MERRMRRGAKRKEKRRQDEDNDRGGGRGAGFSSKAINISVRSILSAQCVTRPPKGSKKKEFCRFMTAI